MGGSGGGARKGSKRLEDIQIGRSVGAKARNYDVMDLATGEKYHFAEGTRLQNVEVFAGKGTRTVFRKAGDYAERYGGKAKDWQHCKGFGVLDTRMVTEKQKYIGYNVKVSENMNFS